MKKLFMLLFSLTIVIGVSAFSGVHEKSPPVPTELVSANDAIISVTLATAELKQDITNEAVNYLNLEAVIPYTEFNLVAPENHRVRWQHPSSYLTSINNEQQAKVKPTLRLNRSCLELNC